MTTRSSLAITPCSSARRSGRAPRNPVSRPVMFSTPLTVPSEPPCQTTSGVKYSPARSGWLPLKTTLTKSRATATRCSTESVWLMKPSLHTVDADRRHRGFGAGGRRPCGVPAGSPSGVHPRSVAKVEPDGLHHLERRSVGEHVRGCEHARVLFDHGCGCGSDHLVQAAPERRLDILAVLLEVTRQVGAVDRLPGALGDVRHVLLVQ